MRELPSGLSGPSFTLAEAREHGIGRGAARGLEIPHRGLRLRPGSPSARTLTDRAFVYAPRMKPWQFFSHETALALLGVPVPWNAALHVSAHRPAREPRIPGVTGHRLQTRDAAWVEDVRGLRVEDPIRAWRQCGRIWGIDDLIIAADHLINPRLGGFELRALVEECAHMGDPGRRLARALADVRVGSDSPRETTLRLGLLRAGLPEPVLSFEVFDVRGTFIARLDAAYPRLGIALEYDGRQHAFDVEQFEKDAYRWRALEAAGWRVVRIVNGDLAGSGTRAVEIVRSALLTAGWRPGLAVD